MLLACVSKHSSVFLVSKNFRYIIAFISNFLVFTLKMYSSFIEVYGQIRSVYIQGLQHADLV